MKLFYAPGACALHVQIVAREAGIDLDLVAADLGTKQTAEGEDLRAINPKGQIPTLVTDEGDALTEGIVLSQYLAERAGNKTLLPPVGTMVRYRVLEAANFVASELHKSFGPLFKQAEEPAAAVARDQVGSALDHLSRMLGDDDVLVGDEFTIVDAYAFNILMWAKPAGIELSRWPNLQAYQKRLGARPAVREALRAEGLLGAAKAS